MTLLITGIITLLIIGEAAISPFRGIISDPMHPNLRSDGISTVRTCSATTPAAGYTSVILRMIA